MSPKASALRNRWLIVIAGGVLMGAALGVRHVQGLFLQPVISSQGWTREDFGLALALQNLVWGLAQPLTGIIADRYGSAKVVFTGMIVYALALMLMTYAQHPTAFALTNGIMIGIALSGTAFGVVYGALSRIFTGPQRTWALAIAGALGGLGQFCMVPAAQALITVSTWQGAISVLCIVMITLTPLALFLRDDMPAAAPGDARASVPAGRASRAPAHSPDDASAKARPAAHPPEAAASTLTMRQAIRQALCHRGFWLLNLGFLACGFQLAFVAAHMPAYLMDRGLSAQQAGMTLAIIALTNIFGNYTCARLAGRWPAKQVLCVLYLLRTLALAAFLAAPVSIWSAYLFSAVMGFLWLGTVPLTTDVILRIFGARYIATLFGFVFVGHQVGGFLGVWLGSVIYDTYHSYDPLWLLSIVIGLLAAGVHWPIDDRPVAYPGPLGGQVS
ncbi:MULTISPECIES: MFS transporter [unclassified Achromobacter]|uniref:MFS transporter n=1 Tax=unclassified Achromobacter TaxID=2626865 RepID=UPI000B51C56F|nr:MULTISPECIES: MFS transporter [unclassified Achromobacter]OWT71444.1 MFS transporter [Achromobacter sp. HZ34]OWT73101.1 MFS transporter [Achromobacter sp. HZ28]